MHSTTGRGVQDLFEVSRWSECKFVPPAATGGSLFTLAVLAAFLLAAAHPALAQTESVLHAFTGTDGANPSAGLAMDAQGNFYGTTSSGGADLYYGTVFQLTPTGTETVLYSFTGGADGAYPYLGAVVRDKAGNLYGTTDGGGANGYGTVFKVTPAGTETVLHSFAGGTDGNQPFAGVIIDKKGNLYGTTYVGGAGASCGSVGCGTVFKVTPAGVETILHSFAADGTDGFTPYAGLVLDKKGNLYGTTLRGGANGYGTVFKVTPKGIESILHSFAADGTDGTNTVAGLIMDKAGNLYGTTMSQIGSPNNAGTVFEITPTGTESVLYSFCQQQNCADGAYPHGGLVLDKTGNLYGTTSNGGANGYGTVFRVTPTGNYSVLHSFAADGTDGISPYGNLTLGKKGKLYGTTLQGGTNAYGTVFRVAP